MSENVLLLLISYTVFLFFGLRKYKLNSLFGVCSGIVTVLSVWLLLYLVFGHQPPSEDPFASVEEIMKDSRKWKVGYMIKNFGFMLGIGYFFVCWFIVSRFNLSEKQN